MRARNIKPGFFQNEILGTLDPFVSLTFEGLWLLADKEGILLDRPLRIKGELFAYRDGLDVNGYLTVLELHGFIVRYSVDGVDYIQILEFHKHQHPHHTEKPKGYPKPPKIPVANQQVTSEQPLAPLNPGDATEKIGATPSDSGFIDSLIPDSLIQDHAPPPPVDNSATVDPPDPVVVFLKSQGIQNLDPLNPEFARLKSGGATMQFWTHGASVAVNSGNPGFAYVLGVVRNQLAAALMGGATVPARKGIDPALAKLDADKLITKPPTEETRQALAKIRAKTWAATQEKLAKGAVHAAQ